MKRKKENMSLTIKHRGECPKCGKTKVLFMRIQAPDNEGGDQILFRTICCRCDLVIWESEPIHVPSGRDPYDYPYDF